MWLSKRGSIEMPGRAAAQSGSVTITGDRVGVYTDSEQREVAVYAPGGYLWRPGENQRVLVVKAGDSGEIPYVMAAAPEELPEDFTAGEVMIRAGGSEIYLKQDGTVHINGRLFINGAPYEG